MKTTNEIIRQSRITVNRVGPDGGHGYIMLDTRKPNKRAEVQWSNGCGWDHVSVSWPSRCPTWEEMCTVKKMFFYAEEICIEYHPAEDEYVSFHPYCLHIWRPQDETIPTPPSWMIGPKKGESMSDLIRKAQDGVKEYYETHRTEKTV